MLRLITLCKAGLYKPYPFKSFILLPKDKQQDYPTSALFRPVGIGTDRGFANLVSEGWHHAKRWHSHRLDIKQTVVCVCILHGLLTRLTMRPRHAALTRLPKSSPFTPYFLSNTNYFLLFFKMRRVTTSLSRRLISSLLS